MIEILGKEADNQTAIISTLKLASSPSSSSFEQGRKAWSPEEFVNLYCATTKDLLNASSKKKQQELPMNIQVHGHHSTKDNSNRYTRGFLNTYLYFGAVHNCYTIVPIAALDGKFCRGSQPALCLPTF